MSTTRTLIAEALADGRPWRTAQLAEYVGSMGGNPGSAKGVAGRMVKHGEIVAVRGGWDWFYFASQDAADAFPAAEFAALVRQQAIDRERRSREANARYVEAMAARRAQRGEAVEPPVKVASQPGKVATYGEVDYSRAKVTHGPSVAYDSRYQCDPKSSPYGAGFAAIGPGRDVTTGRAWGA